MASGAKLIVCDEAVSALDVSVKAQIINLLQELQDDLGLTLLFISHDLAIVEHLTHRVAVMYLGKIVEIADRQTLFRSTSPMNPPSGCRFHTRCPYAFQRCRQEEPLLKPRTDKSHLAACHLDELPANDFSSSHNSSLGFIMAQTTMTDRDTAIPPVSDEDRKNLPSGADQFAWTTAQKLIAHRNMNILFPSKTVSAGEHLYPPQAAEHRCGLSASWRPSHHRLLHSKHECHGAAGYQRWRNRLPQH